MPGCATSTAEIPPKSERDMERFKLDWQGRTLAVSYEADWLGSMSRSPEFGSAHFDVRVIAPTNACLPITETGYRSHFVRPEIVDQHGGPKAFVLAWLEEAAQDPAWIAAEEATKQLTLF